MTAQRASTSVHSLDMFQSVSCIEAQVFRIWVPVWCSLTDKAFEPAMPSCMPAPTWLLTLQCISETMPIVPVHASLICVPMQCTLCQAGVCHGSSCILLL